MLHKEFLLFKFWFVYEKNQGLLQKVWMWEKEEEIYCLASFSFNGTMKPNPSKAFTI